MLEVGANVKMGNLDIFGGLNWTDGGAFDSILGGQVGLRYTW
jgi:outer membrane autotransporter protein